ncbi:hypothetical protein ILUMI_19390 [Ignelater luminosus]|uniref:Uncharacterized protein n=1 Tax=Ignelater luminosus TaxID=2038154 RepID=A0A8K0G5X4_IGNLU|nr:hypothetical protein ILUMI_19390 [Ignelater luminosus]
MLCLVSNFRLVIGDLIPEEVDFTVTLRGIGDTKVKSFERNVEVGGKEFARTFNVIPKSASSFKALIGSNILNQAEISITDEVIMIHKRRSESFLKQGTNGNYCAAFQRTMSEKDLDGFTFREYEYEIQHRKASQMCHVDALSRNPMAFAIIAED